MGRAPCCSKVGLHRGPWTAREDTLLIKYIEAHGEGHWRSLPKKAGLTSREGTSALMKKTSLSDSTRFWATDGLLSQEGYLVELITRSKTTGTPISAKDLRAMEPSRMSRRGHHDPPTETPRRGRRRAMATATKSKRRAAAAEGMKIQQRSRSIYRRPSGSPHSPSQGTTVSSTTVC
uniref:Uncharacterized protein n=1 Tax=Nelumbo nucifera TaxID=4432 RepID=A0A822XFT8_NELNU|nr:TPA_asm: hypothetical protein HUJ06_019433 [Nelumbo nucifera]